MRNSDMFFKVTDKIEAEPETYWQMDWYSSGVLNHERGTTGCIAGHTVAIEENQTLQSKYEEYKESSYSSGLRVRDKATEILGITRDEADILFAGRWKPTEGMTVPDALRKLGGGESLKNVSSSYIYCDNIMESI